MYCISCGVKLADSEKKCPLCGTVPYHPDIQRPEGELLYPPDQLPVEKVKPKVAQMAIAMLFLLPILTVLTIDIRMNSAVTWSGYVAGGSLLGYILFALPGWFRKANPVIFVPCDFAAVCVYLLYICLQTGGKWFLSFAFPVTGGIGLIVTAMVTLLRYVRRGKLYIVGGGIMTMGAFMLLVEFLLVITFRCSFVGWSLYPMMGLLMLGGFLIYLAINHSARETVERKVFF